MVGLTHSSATHVDDSPRSSGLADRVTFAARVAEVSLNAQSEKRTPIGTLEHGIHLGRGQLSSEYACSNGREFGETLPILGARGGTAATLDIVKLRSGSIIHNLSIELSAKKKDGPDIGSPAVRTASLFFPSQAVQDPVALLLESVREPSSLSPGQAKRFDLAQLIDASGKPLAQNLFNVVESSAERWRELCRFGQRPQSFDVLVEKTAGESLKLTFRAAVKTPRGDMQEKSKVYYYSENRLLTEAEHSALEQTYDLAPPGITKEYFQWFREQQFLAWLWRKHLEPGGDNHAGTQDLESVQKNGLESLFFTSNGLASQDEKSFIFAARLSAEIIQNLSALGTENLRQMQSAGQTLLTCGTTLERGEFTAQNIAAGVPCLGSDPARLDPLLVLTGANLHHEGWMRTIDWMNSQQAPELKIERRKEQTRYAFDTLSPFAVRDAGNFYGLSFLCGSMNEQNFAPLMRIAETQRAELLPLSSEQISRLLGMSRTSATAGVKASS